MDSTGRSTKQLLVASLAALAVGAVVGWAARQPPDGTTATTTAPSAGPTSTVEPSVPADPVIANPVLGSDFPDPDIVRTADGYVAFATTSGGRHVQVARSGDLTSWSAPTEALPELPPWVPAARPDIWAPDVVVTDDGRAVMAFAGREATSRRMCIGLATSDDIDGPFAALPEPLVCPVADGGAIDPAILVRSDGAWLYWKVDGNCCAQPVSIAVQRFDVGSLSLLGEPVRLLTPNHEWEQGIVEAPDPILVDGTVHLLYSGGRYADGSYGVGLARCEAVTGPCNQVSTFPLVGTRVGAVGPGGTSAFTAPDGSTWLAYHAWTEPHLGYPDGARTMRIDRTVVTPDGVTVLGPT